MFDNRIITAKGICPPFTGTMIAGLPPCLGDAPDRLMHETARAQGGHRQLTIDSE
jgi:hypothetical protein